MVPTAVDMWPAYARPSAVAHAGYLPTAPTRLSVTGPLVWRVCWMQSLRSVLPTRRQGVLPPPP